MASPRPLISPNGWPVGGYGQGGPAPAPAPAPAMQRRISPAIEAFSAKRIAGVWGKPGSERIRYYSPHNPGPPGLSGPDSFGESPLIPAQHEPLDNHLSSSETWFIELWRDLFGSPLRCLPPDLYPYRDTHLAPRHIALPFNLRQNPKAILSEDNMRTLLRLYHGTSLVGVVGYYLVFEMSELPPCPWPKTIAGLTPSFKSPYARHLCC